MKIDYFKEIEKLIEKTPKFIYLEFAIYCARDVLPNINNESLRNTCSDVLDTVEAYNKGLASEQDLAKANSAANSAAYSAAHAANSAANSAASAAHAAYSAAHAASAAHSAAYSAAYAAYSAASAAYAANSAANSAAHAAYSAANSVKLKQYYEYLLLLLKNMTRLEKILYEVRDELHVD